MSFFSNNTQDMNPSRQPRFSGNKSRKRRRSNFLLSDNLFFTGFAVIVVLIILSMIVGFPGVIVKDTKSKQLLDNLGFTNVTQTAKHTHFVQLRGCSEQDMVRFDYRAINQAGKTVNISVCQGWPFKGATLRQ